jgi:hypothetical protein
MSSRVNTVPMVLILAGRMFVASGNPNAEVTSKPSVAPTRPPRPERVESGSGSPRQSPSRYRLDWVSKKCELHTREPSSRRQNRAMVLGVCCWTYL